ncbi:MAG: hypothetical protein JXR10_14455 [Cyclobacteriaceae bacterium]
MTNIEFLLSENVRAFIQTHVSSDVSQLMLNPPAEFRENIRLIGEQIKSRQKIKLKLPNWYEDLRVIMPSALSTEQSSSIPTAEYKAKLLRGEILIDLTGGMGVDTLALAEQYEKSHYVERSEQLCDVFRHNSKVLSKCKIDIHNTDAETFLERFKGKASFFIDPARREKQKKVFHFENCSPNVIAMLPLFKEKAEQVMIKAAPMIDISLGIKQLQYAREVHVVSVKNEVKEVLFLLDFNINASPLIKCVNLDSNHPELTFSQEEESNQNVAYSDIQNYLYDPNASITKAGAFKTVAARYEISKVSSNTHLYSSDRLIEDFPGRRFEVIEPHLNKKNIKTLLPNRKANVMAKNYPMKADALRKQLKLEDGGEMFVVGYRTLQQKSNLTLVRSI